MTHATCSIGDCLKPTRSPGSALCGMHYHRWYRHGDVNISAASTSVTASHGKHYRMVYLPAHPMAGANGKAYEHRVVLYGSIGAGCHSCHWCKVPVRWEARQHTPDYLTVDHVNGKTDDNRAENLVPSCLGCNVTRGAQSRSQALREAGWWSRNDTVQRLRGRRPTIVAQPLGDRDDTVQPMSIG